jgi:hypothetical protein
MWVSVLAGGGDGSAGMAASASVGVVPPGVVEFRVG